LSSGLAISSCLLFNIKRSPEIVLINLASRERLRGILRILETEKMNEILIVYPDGVNPQIAAAVAKYLLYLCVGKFMQAQ
jgi:hypothetical protein